MLLVRSAYIGTRDCQTGSGVDLVDFLTLPISTDELLHTNKGCMHVVDLGLVPKWFYNCEVDGDVREIWNRD